MVKWIFLVVLIGVSVIRVANYTPIEDIYTDGQRIKLTTTILDTPKDWGWKKTLNITGITVNMPPDVILSIGDVVEITGSLKIKLTEEKRRILSLDTAVIQTKSSERSFRVLMANIRSIVISRLLSWLPGDVGALAAGILVGGDEFMSESGVLAFRKAGISHIVAASGYNVTVVSAWAELILIRWLNKIFVIYIGIVSIILYIFLAGGTAAVVRAGIMSTMVMIGKIWGRESDGGWILLLTSLIMVIWTPGWFWDIGFQLSVAAMAGMIFLAGKSLWSQSLACQITTMPLILHYFGNLSIVSPLANILFLWPVPVVMPILAIATVVGIFLPSGGSVLSLLTWPLLNYMNKGANFISSANWAQLAVDKMNWGWVFIYYLILIIIKWKLLRYEHRD